MIFVERDLRHELVGFVRRKVKVAADQDVPQVRLRDPPVGQRLDTQADHTLCQRSGDTVQMRRHVRHLAQRLLLEQPVRPESLQPLHDRVLERVLHPLLLRSADRKHPLVLQAFRGRRTPRPVPVQHSLHEVLRRRRQPLPRLVTEIQVGIQDGPENVLVRASHAVHKVPRNLVPLLSRPRQLPCQHHVRHQPRAPHVRLVPIIALQDFRRDIHRRPRPHIHPLARLAEHRDPKVDRLERRTPVVRVGKQKIVRLDIPDQHPLRVTQRRHPQHVPHNPAQVLPRVPLPPHDRIPQRTPRAHLHHDIHLRIILIHLVHIRNIQTPTQMIPNVHLVPNPPHVIPVQRPPHPKPLLHPLHGILLPAHNLNTLIHLPKRPTPQNIPQNIPIPEPALIPKPRGRLVVRLVVHRLVVLRVGPHHDRATPPTATTTDVGSHPRHRR